MPKGPRGEKRPADRGDMTRDLAILIRADHPWLTTNQFLDKLDANLQKAMAP
jgi:isocitrate dehydrogenase